MKNVPNFIPILLGVNSGTVLLGEAMCLEKGTWQ